MADEKTIEAPTPGDLLAAALLDLNHNDEAQWEGNFPSLTFLSGVLKRDVTREDILAEDVDGYPRKAKMVDDGKGGEDSEKAIATAPPKPVAPPPVSVEQRQAEKKKLEDLLAVASKDEQAAKAKRVDLEKKRDFVVSELDKAAKHGQSAMLQKLFASNDKANEERQAQLAKFRETTGGVIPSKFASKLDEASANKRGLVRRAQRMGLGG